LTQGPRAGRAGWAVLAALLGLALLASGGSPAQGAPPVAAVDPARDVLTLEQWMDRGFAARERGDTWSARQAFEAAVQVDTDDPRAWLELAYTLIGIAGESHEEDDFRAAQRALAVALVRGADPAATWMQFGYLTVQFAETTQHYLQLECARRAFEVALVAGAEPAGVHLELGHVSAAQGRVTEALSHFHRAARAAEATLRQADAPPERIAAARAVLSAATQEIDASRGRPSEVGEHQPDWFEVGLESMRHGDMDGARAAFEAALAAGADPETVHAELGYVAMMQERPEDALAEFRQADLARRESLGRALDRPPEPASEAEAEPPSAFDYGEWVEAKSGAEWLVMAWQRKANGDIPGAIAAFEAARLLGADPQLILLELGYLEVARQRPEAARRHFQAVIDYAEQQSMANPDDDAGMRSIWDRAGQARAELRALGQEVRSGRAPEPVIEEVMARNAADWLQIGSRQREKGNQELAARAFAAARQWGADPSLVELELGYLAQEQGRTEEALVHFAQASNLALARDSTAPASLDELRAHGASRWAEARRGGWDQESAPQAPRDWLQLAWTRRAAGDFAGAEEALQQALQAGGDEASIAMELGYVAHAQGHYEESAAWFKRARQASGQAIRQARSELDALHPTFRGEAYGQLFGWHRFYPYKLSDLLPYVQVRGYWHPIAAVDFDPFVYANASRDLASRGQGELGYPVIYADNTVGLGAGARYRFWERRAGAFAQVGTAINLLDDGRQRAWFDLRLGAWLDLEASDGCWPAPLTDGTGARAPMTLCWETWGEAVYVSRFDHNLLGQVRGRVGASAMVTGPVAWQPLLESRVHKDVLNEYWNNLAEVGAVHRWRLLTPLRLDLLAGLHFGTYFGLYREDPPPTPLRYAEVRLLLESGFDF